jgi:hypothetical protein
MATTNKSTHRSLVTLSLPKSVPGLIVYAQNIVKQMTDNPSFPNPAPTLAAVTAAIDELRAAEAAAIARTKGAAATRNDKRKALVAILEQLRAYIQLCERCHPRATNAYEKMTIDGWPDSRRCEKPPPLALG